MSVIEKEVRVTPRNTQKERASATRRLLLDATLKCMADYGYASTSISKIIESAKVSRGALLYHFPSKDELVAAAMVHFYARLSEEIARRLSDTDPESCTLKQRLDVIRDVYGENAAVRIEFMVASRTNSSLANAFLQRNTDNSVVLCPELEDLPESNEMETMIGVFLVGLNLETGLIGDTGESTYNFFMKVFQAYLDSQATPSGKAG